MRAPPTRTHHAPYRPGGGTTARSVLTSHNKPFLQVVRRAVKEELEPKQELMKEEGWDNGWDSAGNLTYPIEEEDKQLTCVP
jgi:hypothetical protein